MILQKYSMGIGDRFGRQGMAQLAAFTAAKKLGVEVAPVWNKSNREHQIIGSEPTSVRDEADAAVRALGWDGQYYVDADHIGMETVERFLPSSDFFTIDVADYTGKPAQASDIQAFAAGLSRYVGELRVAGIARPLSITREAIDSTAQKYLLAVQEAARVYRHIEASRGRDRFVAEVSMDETDAPQTPQELMLILAAIAEEQVPLQTIAPKFSGRFNKGVDYAGDTGSFEQEFNDDLAVIAFAVREFGLPSNLKLSVHSGSDKFSLYPIINRALKKHNAGIHVKTAGTTWLEELIGLAESGGEGLLIAKSVYAASLSRFDELCAPYAPVLDIDKSALPSAAEVDAWSAEHYAASLRHDQDCIRYNPHFRQLLHVGYKVAAELGERYLSALAAAEREVSRNVTANLLDRHIRPLFIDA